ncbi:MAG: F0F1 ATP synthase subunit epsilon [Proteobacteria bacterium]|nr:F0F1 ATP synthase subunit epsilon [Pseudomonadota bacterium]
MADNIKLEVVTPEKSVVSEEAQIVMSPGSEGEFGVLDGHTPFLTTLKAGMIRYKDTSGAERAVFVSGGFAEALPDRVTILAESAERRRDINIDRAKAALSRAEERIGKGMSDNEIDVIRAKAALIRAITRLNVVQTK